MSLSTAIRLGSLLKPQAFGGYHKDGGSCALGAAADAIGMDVDTVPMVSPWPDEWIRIITALFAVPCPVCRKQDFLISHLNDIHFWSRERIAAYVEQFESVQEPAAETVAVQRT